VKEILSSLNYSNLDEHPDFKGRRSTTEAVAKWTFDKVKLAIAAGRLGPSASGIARLKITLHESHTALAAYEADI
jgi:6-pyruvoyl-tetrahydropterin synthase